MSEVALDLCGQPIYGSGVYAWVDLVAGEPFYYGKGTFDRCLNDHSHAKAQKRRDKLEQLPGEEYRTKRSFRKGGFLAVQLRDNIDEKTAYATEALLIKDCDHIEQSQSGAHMKAMREVVCGDYTMSPIMSMIYGMDSSAGEITTPKATAEELAYHALTHWRHNYFKGQMLIPCVGMGSLLMAVMEIADAMGVLEYITDKVVVQDVSEVMIALMAVRFANTKYTGKFQFRTGDFFKMANEQYDVVLMNPPFKADGKEIWRTFIDKAHSMLADDGVVIAIHPKVDETKIHELDQRPLIDTIIFEAASTPGMAVEIHASATRISRKTDFKLLANIKFAGIEKIERATKEQGVWRWTKSAWSDPFVIIPRRAHATQEHVKLRTDFPEVGAVDYLCIGGPGAPALAAAMEKHDFITKWKCRVESKRIGKAAPVMTHRDICEVLNELYDMEYDV